MCLSFKVERYAEGENHSRDPEERQPQSCAATVAQPHPPFLLLRATVFEKKARRVPLDKGEGGVKDKSFLAVAMLDTNISSSPSFPIMAIQRRHCGAGGRGLANAVLLPLRAEIRMGFLRIDS